MRTSTFAALAFLAAAPAARAQYLLVPDVANDTVGLFSAFDGSLINASYINGVPAGATNLIEALVVGNEIWVIDQTDDLIYRYTLDGVTHLGNHGGVGILDNCRGGEVVGNEVWVSNSGSGSGAPGDAIVRFNFAGTPLGNFAVPDPFDVVNFQGDVLIADIANDDILRYTAAGAFVSVFHNSDGITGVDFPGQTTVRANGNVLVAGLSDPTGIFEYDPTGAQINYWMPTLSLRAAIELGNGKILYTASNGLSVLDPVGGGSTLVVAGNRRFFTPFAGANPPPVPYCFGDGSGTACPCTPVPLVGDADKGCPNSFNAGGGKLTASGVASIGNDTLVMTCTLINNGGAVVFQGTNDNGGGLGTAFGDGLRCAAGSVRRMRSHSVTTNTHQYPDPMFGDNAISIRGAVLAPGDRWYQGWYRSGLAHCDPTQNYNLTNAVKITWVP